MNENRDEVEIRKEEEDDVDMNTRSIDGIKAKCDENEILKEEIKRLKEALEEKSLEEKERDEFFIDRSKFKRQKKVRMKQEGEDQKKKIGKNMRKKLNRRKEGENFEEEELNKTKF